jgi:hypothetical protein
MCVFVIGNYLITGKYLPTTNTKDLWFYSGLFMVLFSVLFIEPYYTSPKNVITNTIPLLLVFLSIKQGFENIVVWQTTFWIIFTILILSIIPLLLSDEEKSPNHWKNKISKFLKKFVTFIGKGKIIYSAVFLIFLYTNITSPSEKGFEKVFDIYFVFLLILWGLILSINPNELKNTFTFKENTQNKNAIGTIFGIQSKKIFLVKLFEQRTSIKKFDIVKFRYSMQDSDDLDITGIVFNTYLLNQEKWAKILQLDKVQKQNVALDKNIVYKINTKMRKKG